nr:P-loop NTPase fold protein [uncultured Porphyromonas sp.]
MSTNNAPQNQDVSSASPSQEATPEPQSQDTGSPGPSQEATPEPQNQDAGSASPSQEAAPEGQSQDVSSPSPSQEATPEPQNQDAGSKTATTQPKESLKSICQRSLDSLFDWLAEVRVPFILGLLFLFLHQPIEQLAIERLVTPLLAHFDTGWLSSLIALGLALILFLRFIQLGWRHYIVGGKVVLSACLVLLGYRYYRFARPDFEFYGLFGQTWTFAFADLIPIACAVPLFLWIRALCTKRRANQERQAAESVEGFLTDHPLSEEEEELSGWTSQAQALTQKLLATDTSHAAFSLGIVASWGEGKSSFMGIMQRYLRRVHREIIVMHFNPWLYDKEAQLTKVFFEELRRTLAPYSSKLSRSIDSYAELLLAVDNGWLKLAHGLLRLSQRSTTEQFDKLSRDIKELSRKVVIFIDDVDRLTREELMELFNLVRNSSNLPCLYFVLAYDKSYVLKTLQSDGEHMSRYPEKILQEEYPLPKLTSYKIWEALEQCLNETQFGRENYILAEQLLYELKRRGVNLPYHLTTIRMVKRMVNGFSSRYEQLHEAGVDLLDLFIFELIYYVYPSVYDYLKEMYQTHTNYTTRETPSIWNTYCYQVFLGPSWQEILSQNLFERNHCSYSSIDQQQIELLINTLWSDSRQCRAPQINDLPSLGRYFYRSPLA